MLPSIKSEPIPEKPEGPVTVIVAHNYKDIVLDDKKDVLLEFYAPWVNSSVPNLTYNSVWTLQESCPEIRTISRCLLSLFRQGRYR